MAVLARRFKVLVSRVFRKNDKTEGKPINRPVSKKISAPIDYGAAFLEAHF